MSSRRQETPQPPQAPAAGQGLLASAAIWLIRGYQRLLSPLLLRCCRFEPSCSAYAIEALRKKGLVRGSLKAAWRILRCNPFCKGGYDPVDPPEHDPPPEDALPPQPPRKA